MAVKWYIITPQGSEIQINRSDSDQTCSQFIIFLFEIIVVLLGIVGTNHAHFASTNLC